MPVGADASHEKLNSPGGFDGFLVGAAFPLRIRCHSVEDVGIFRHNVYGAEKVVVHKAPVTLGMIRGKPQVLVHVEANHIGKGNFSCLTGSDKHLVNSQGG
jgi:hypothetical protein